MNVLLVCPMEDNQSGLYLHDSLIEMGHNVAFFDWRKVLEEKGGKALNDMLVEAVDELKPDLTLVIKGLGIDAVTIKKMRETHKHPIVCWIFDVTLGGRYVKDVPQYIEVIKQYDTFYTIDNSAIPELTALGVNAKWLSEGCFPRQHKEEIINFMQKKKYGEDIVFLGSIGSIHPNRSAILKRLHDEGFKFKIYGQVYFPDGQDPNWAKDHHTGFEAINDYHSMVVNSSKIVLGIDGWPDREKAYSARLYRTLCPGGFYLTTHTKGIEEEFVPGEHLDTYKDLDELVEKVTYYLMNDEERERIAKAGQELVLKKHQFTNRLQIILDDHRKV